MSRAASGMPATRVEPKVSQDSPTPPRSSETRQRRGSEVSDKQIAQAAINGRRVTFRFLSTQPSQEVTGYVVGMDDYHWMVATVVPSEERKANEPPVFNALVHKSRVDIIRLWPVSSIDAEDEPVQTLLHQVGGAFWRYCERHYMGRKGPEHTRENHS